MFSVRVDEVRRIYVQVEWGRSVLVIATHSVRKFCVRREICGKTDRRTAFSDDLISLTLNDLDAILRQRNVRATSLVHVRDAKIIITIRIESTTIG